jgi:aarF domain-containing kinase
MSGKRLLDAIALFNVSRSVASKHVALRKHQLDRFSKTSSVVQGVQSQTDRVALTIKAASVLAGRFNEQTTRQEGSSTPENDSTPASHGNVKESSAATAGGEDIIRDNSYTQSVGSSTGEQVASEEPGVIRTETERPTSVDETVSSSTGPSGEASRSLEETINAQQRAGFQIPPREAQPATSKEGAGWPSPTSQVAQDQNKPSEEMVKELFHSPKVARLLSNNKDRPFSKYDLATKYGKQIPTGPIGVKRNQITGDNISTFTAASGSNFTPILEEKDDEDLSKLGADIAGDVAASEPLVSWPQGFTII